MPIAAAYARYSTDEQRPTSIEDQLRRCREAAAAKGLTIEDQWIFQDSAISAAEKGKRPAFSRLMDAILSRAVDVVFIDDVSRAARNITEGARLMELVDTIGLRIVSVDGLDSTNESWMPLMFFKLMAAVHQVESTANQVTRGMVGQLVRGYQIAQPPLGYVGTKVKSEQGSEIGTVWHVEPKSATVVSKMYAMRFSGMSVANIAKELNSLKIDPPRPKLCKGEVYWRPATVHRLLANTIYRGIFVWNGSAFTRAKARKKRKVVQTVEYQRPHLRLVSDEVWAACNAGGGKNYVRGGGRHALAGIMSCGVCQAILTIHGGPKSWAVHCPQCEQARRVGGHDRFLGYSSLAAAKEAMEWCLTQLFTGDILQEFHRRLRARLITAPANEEARCRARLSELDVLLQRLVKLNADPDIDEEVVRKEMSHASLEKKARSAELNAMLAKSSQVTKEAVDLQASVEPLPLIRRLLDGDSEAYKVRATLKRLISKFELVAKPGRGISVFELAFIAGIGVAELSESEPIDSEPVAFRVTVSVPASRPVVWTVSGQRM